jgi:hypothetical protein
MPVNLEAQKAAEGAREKNRKRTSPHRGATESPNTNWGREKQARESVVPGQLNKGSNQNAGHPGEQESAPDSARTDHDHSEFASGAVPSQAAFESKGESAERAVKASKATLGRHVQSGHDGKAVSSERADHVAQKRAETAAIFDKHRTKSSSV